jgi:hypothetical protein
MFRVGRGSKLVDRERLLPQKRIQAPDTRRGEIKILDSCSRAQIHLWSKSQILRRWRSPNVLGRMSTRFLPMSIAWGLPLVLR